MEAKAEPDLPKGEDWRYEPKRSRPSSGSSASKQEMVLLSPQTSSLKTARGWPTMAGAGRDGIVAAG